MHWGHTVSKDLIHWSNKEIALSPFHLGTIYSGCALTDKRNVTGLKKVKKLLLKEIKKINFHQLAAVRRKTNRFLSANSNEQKDGIDPMIIIYTIDDAGFEQQGLAYSTDGDTYHQYEHNPIIANPNIRDFRFVTFVVLNQNF